MVDRLSTCDSDRGRCRDKHEQALEKSEVDPVRDSHRHENGQAPNGVGGNFHTLPVNGSWLRWRATQFFQAYKYPVTIGWRQGRRIIDSCHKMHRRARQNYGAYVQVVERGVDGYLMLC